jgi:hydroxyethylthiazole kinase-like sugar kinase family protein
LLLLLATGCGKRAESQATPVAVSPSAVGVVSVKATCAAGELVVTGTSRLRGGDGELLLLVEGQERGRVGLEEGDDLPFAIECSGVAAGEHECELVYFGTRIVASPNGDVEKLTVRQRVSGPLPIKVICE